VWEVAERTDVAVVGTGVVGLAVAAAVLARGLSVTVIGRRDGAHLGQASRAAGAMLSTFSEIEPGQDPDRVRVETAERLAANERYPEWLSTINTAAGTDVQAVAGTWVLAQPGRSAHLHPIATAARAAGHCAEEHHPQDIAELTAPASCETALWLPGEARIDSAALLDALTHAVAAHSRSQWQDTTAVAVRPGHVECATGDQVKTSAVVLAAGTGIPALLPDGGADLGVPPILAGRGASVLLRAAGLRLPYVVRTPNAAFACGVHLVPRHDGTLYLGGTNRLTINPDPHQPATLDELAMLFAGATTQLTTALAAAHPLTPRVGLRPYTLDHLPLVGPTREPSLLLATGTYRCGVLLAPRIAALIADEISSPGVLAEHPYRVLRPMPTPEPAQIVTAGVGALLEHLLQNGGFLPPDKAAEFTAFAGLALRALTDGTTRAGAPLRRLWAAAPVVEAVPSLFALAQRLHGSQP
jgi:glycine/D-amino acid oxidase-like deaminating enzyme